MVLAHGGHLTHGSPVNVSGKWFNFVGYEVDRETEQLGMDRIRDLAKATPQDHPERLHRLSPQIDFAAFREIADEVGALLWVDASHFIGLVAGGAYPSPVPYADVVTFTTHKALRGPRGAMIVCKEEHAKAIDKAVFPMMQGGPLEHCIAAKAVALKERPPEFKAYATRRPRCAGPGRRAHRRGAPHRFRRHRFAPDPGRHAAARHRRQDRRGRGRRGGHRAQQEPDPLRPEPALDPVGIRVGTPGPSTLGMDGPRCARSGASWATS